MLNTGVGIKLGIDGTAKVEADLHRVSGALGNVGKAGASAKNLLAGLGMGVAATVGGLMTWVKSAVNAADEMSKLSQRTGIATKDIAGLQLAFKQSGLGADELGTTMGRMSRSMVDNGKAFEAMGVKTKDAAGKMRNVRDVLGDVADKFKGYEDGAAKVALANEILGKGADRLIPLLNGGSEALAEFDATAERLGLTISETAGKQAEKFNDTMDLVGMGVQGTARKVATELLPTLVGLSSQFLASMNAGDGFKRVADSLSVALRTLYITGVGIATAFRAVGKTLGAVAAIITAVLAGDFKAARTRAISKEFQESMADLGKNAAQSMKDAWNAASDPAVEAVGKLATVMQQEAPKVEAAARRKAKAVKAMAKEIKIAIDDSAGKAFTKAMEDFGRMASDAEAKAEGLTRVQARLREIMASPEWSKMSRQMQEQTIYAASLAEGNDDWADAVDRARKALADAATQYQEYTDAQQESVAAAMSEADAAKKAVAQYGLLTSQVHQLTRAKLEEARATAALAGEDTRYLDQRIKIMDELIASAKELEEIQSMEKSAKQAADEWQKASDQINQSLTDALMRAAESGKGFFKSLRDSVVAMFKTMILRPIVQAVVNPVAGAVNNAISGALGQFLPGLAGGAAGAASMGPLGWAILGAVAVSSIFDRFRSRGGPKVDGVAGPTPMSGIGTSADQSLRGLAQEHRQAMLQTFLDWYRTLGGRGVSNVNFGVGISTDPRGTAPSMAGITGFVDGRWAVDVSNRGIARNEQALQQALQDMSVRAIVGALRQADFGARFNEYLRAIPLDAPKEVLMAALETMGHVRTFTNALRGMGPAFLMVGEKSVAARKRIIDMAGGIERLMQGISIYADNFLTTAQRRTMIAEQVAQAMRDSGFTVFSSQLMNYTRATIREWVQGLNMETEAGQVSFARIMSNMQGLLAIVEANEAHWSDLEGAFEDTAKDVRTFTTAVLRMGDDFGYVASMSERARQRIIDLAGGIDKLASGMTQYVATFLSSEEQRRLLARNLANDMRAAGIDANAEALLTYNRDTIKKWVDSLDLRTAQGQQAFAGIMGNMDQLARLIQMNEALWDEQAEALRKHNEALEKERARLEGIADKYRSAMEGISDTVLDEIQRLRGASGKPGSTLAELQARFATTTAQARAGDNDAFRKLPDLTRAIEEAAAKSVSTSEELRRVRESLAASLAATVTATQAHANSLDAAAGRQPQSWIGDTPLQHKAQQPEQEVVQVIKENAEETALQQRQLISLVTRFTQIVARWDADGMPEERQTI